MLKVVKVSFLAGLSLVLFLLSGYSQTAEKFGGKRVIAWLRTAALGSPEEQKKGQFWKAEDIKGEKFTELILAHAQFKDLTNIVFNDMNDDTNLGVPGNKNLLVEVGKLRKKYPDLKMILSIGGWAVEGFSDMAFNPQTRNDFAANAVDWVKQNNFDGIQICWEYPVNGGWGVIKARGDDRKDYTLLMQALRTKFDELGKVTGKKYILTIFAGATYDFLTWIEPVPMAQVLDYFDVGCFDFQGGWSPLASHSANLYANPQMKAELYVDKVLKTYLRNGITKDKFVVGIPFYGQSFYGVVGGPPLFGLNRPFKKMGTPQTPSYSEIQDMMAKDPAFKRYWDNDAKEGYIYNGTTWITFDDEQAIVEKIKYVKDQGLAGVMVNEYTQDMGGTLLDAIDKNLAQ